jgi:Ser/Thr protein kinase RdoA (MazF antagonist)
MVTISENVLSEAARRFGVAPAMLKYLGGMDGAVYEFMREGQPFVLKVAPSLTEKIPRLHERLEFVHYLGANGVRVAAPLPSSQGELVEVVQEGKATYVVSTMRYAHGD